MFWAVELVSDRETRTPLAGSDMATLKRLLLDRGLLPFVADNRLHVVPPAVVTAEEAMRGVSIIDDALTELGA